MRRRPTVTPFRSTQPWDARVCLIDADTSSAAMSVG